MNTNRFSAIFQDQVAFTDSIEMTPVTVSDSKAKNSKGKKTTSNKQAQNSLELIALAIKKREEERRRLEEEKIKAEEERLRQLEEAKREEEERRLAAEKKRKEERAYRESLARSEEEGFKRERGHHQRHHREYEKHLQNVNASPRQLHRYHDREDRSGKAHREPKQFNFKKESRYNETGESSSISILETVQSNHQLDQKSIPTSVDNKENVPASLSSTTTTTAKTTSEESFLTLDQYLAEKAKNYLNIELQMRRPNEQVDDPKWRKAVPLVKKEEELFHFDHSKKMMHKNSSVESIKSNSVVSTPKPIKTIDSRTNSNDYSSKPSTKSSSTSARREHR